MYLDTIAQDYIVIRGEGSGISTTCRRRLAKKNPIDIVKKQRFINLSISQSTNYRSISLGSQPGLHTFRIPGQ